MPTVPVRVPCLWCRGGLVVVQRASWETPLGRRGGVWVDEPVRCSRGCVLHSEDIQRVLLRVLERPEGASVRQLALWSEEVRG